MPALVRAAAHMGDREHEAAVDEREAVGRETRLDRIAVCAIADDDERRRGIEREPALVHERHRHALAVLGGREHKARHVGARVETARYRLPLDEGSRALGAVVVVDLLRPIHRRIAEAEKAVVELVHGLETESVGLLVEGNVMRLAAPQVVHRKAWAALLARQHDEMVSEQRRGSDKASVAMQDDVSPVSFARALAWRGDDLEILRPGVGAEIKAVAVIHHVVEEARPPRRDEERLCRGESRSTTCVSEPSCPRTTMSAERPSRVRPILMNQAGSAS